MNSLWQDLRYGIRVLARSPGFAAIAVLTLALGIGANTAIFSVVYGVLLRPLPYPQPERIAVLTVSYKGRTGYSGFTAREFDFWKQHSEPFAFLSASHGLGFNLTGGTQPVRTRALRVSSSYFNVLGVQPRIGRNFSADEDAQSGPNVVILSYGLWQSQFGGNEALVGKTVSLNGTPFTVVGIMPSGFQSVPPADLWTTIAQVNASVGSGINYSLLGRLKDGISREQAEAYFSSVTPSFLQQFRTHQISPNERPLVAFHPTPLGYMVAIEYHTPLLALFGAIAFVMLIACVNVANLLLARAGTRTREIALRTALGADRSRVVRQLLTESLLLALLGGMFGIFLAYLGLNVLLRLAPTDLPRATDIALDGWALGFSVVASAFCGILFGMAPAFQASKMDLIESLKESGRSSAGLGRQRMRGALVIAEVALSLVLLAGASLLIETFAKLLRTNPGFDPHPILSVQVWPSGEEIPSTDAMVNFHRNVIHRIEGIPGVQSASIVTGGLPLEQGGNEYFTFVGRKQGEGVSADYREITPDYFRTLGVPLQQGRLFTDADSATSRKVAIINEEFARQCLSGVVLGQHIKLEGNVDMEIVGVAGNVRSFLNEAAPPTVFIPDTQADVGETKGFISWFPASVLVRTSQNPLSVSKDTVNAIHAADSAVPIGQVHSMEDVLSIAVAFQKFLMTLMSTFAGLALVLATVGLYGVMAYTVAQRTHEIGIRMTIGAQASDVWRMVIRHGMLLTAVGIGLGLIGAAGLTRLLADQLYGVKPADPLALLVAVFALALVAFAACWIPARRATRVDPVVALRYE